MSALSARWGEGIIPFANPNGPRYLDLMIKKISSPQEILDEMSRIRATLNGEILAARVLAIHAIEILVRNASDPIPNLTRLHQQMLREIKNAHPDDEAGADEMDVISTERALQRIDESFSELRRLLQPK